MGNRSRRHWFVRSRTNLTASNAADTGHISRGRDGLPQKRHCGVSTQRLGCPGRPQIPTTIQRGAPACVAVATSAWRRPGGRTLPTPRVARASRPCRFFEIRDHAAARVGQASSPFDSQVASRPCRTESVSLPSLFRVSRFGFRIWLHLLRSVLACNLPTRRILSASMAASAYDGRTGRFVCWICYRRRTPSMELKPNASGEIIL